MSFEYKPAGDLSVLVKVSDQIDDETNAKIIGLANIVESKLHLGFDEVILGYNTLLVSYNPLKMTYLEAISQLRIWEEDVENEEPKNSNIIEIPTLYGGEWGPDLEDVAEYNGLTPEEVVSIHSSNRYLVYFIGFTPGFPFLGGMSRKISTPRLSTPRISIPAGSVGIANNQTGIYPVSSPGGWRLIGRTPLKLFSFKNEENPFLLNPGDYLEFKQIDEEEFLKIKTEVEKGIYKPVIKRSERNEYV